MQMLVRLWLTVSLNLSLLATTTITTFYSHILFHTMPDTLPPPPWTDVRGMTKSRQERIEVPSFLRISPDVRASMQHQLDEVGADGRRFGYTTEEQGAW